MFNRLCRCPTVPRTLIPTQRKMSSATTCHPRPQGLSLDPEAALDQWHMASWRWDTPRGLSGNKPQLPAVVTLLNWPLALPCLAAPVIPLAVPPGIISHVHLNSCLCLGQLLGNPNQYIGCSNAFVWKRGRCVWQHWKPPLQDLSSLEYRAMPRSRSLGYRLPLLMWLFQDWDSLLILDQYFLLWSIVHVQYYTSYRCTIWRVTIFKGNTPFIVIIKCWLYSPCCTVYSCSLFYT